MQCAKKVMSKQNNRRAVSSCRERSLMRIACGTRRFTISTRSAPLEASARKGEHLHHEKSRLGVAFWVALALPSTGHLFLWAQNAALNFLAGYLIEKSLSIDNLFVFIAIFRISSNSPNSPQKCFFGAHWRYRHAPALHFSGIALFTAFHWVFYLFGLFLLYAAFKIANPRKKALNLPHCPD